MHLPSLTVLLASLASFTSAHYTLQSPQWRDDSLGNEDYSQWVWPCAGVPEGLSQTNRTLWPLTGGSLKAKFGHEWAITYVNLGLGNNVSAFNVSLLGDYNQTGAGEFCLPELGRAALAELDIKEGMNASIQVIQISHSGASLYNCADITFSSKGSLLNDTTCKNDTGVSGVPLTPEEAQTSPTDTPTNDTATGGAAGITTLTPLVLSAAVAVGSVLLAL